MQIMKGFYNQSLSVKTDVQVSGDALEVVPLVPKAKADVSLYVDETASGDAKRLPKVRKRPIHLSEATLGIFNSPHQQRDELCRLLDRLQDRVDKWKPSQILQCLIHAVEFYATNFGLQHKLLMLLKRNLIYLTDSQVTNLLSKGFSNVDLVGVSDALTLPQIQDATESNKVKLCIVQGEVLMALMDLYTIRGKNALPCKESMHVFVGIQTHLLMFVTSLPSLYKWDIVSGICNDLLDYIEEYNLASANALDSVVNALCAQVLNDCAQISDAIDVLHPSTKLCKDILAQEAASRIQYTGVNPHAFRIFVDCIVCLNILHRLNEDEVLASLVNRTLTKCTELKTRKEHQLPRWFGCMYKASCLSQVFSQHRTMVLEGALNLAKSYEGNTPQMVSIALGILLNSNDKHIEFNKIIPLLFHKLYKVREIDNVAIFDILSSAWNKHKYFHHACGTWLFDVALRRTPRTMLDSLIMTLIYTTQKRLPFNIVGTNDSTASAKAMAALSKYVDKYSKANHGGGSRILTSTFTALKCQTATLNSARIAKNWAARNARIHRLISRLLL